MLPTIKIIKKIITCSLMVIFSWATAQAQTTQPVWWYGISGAANLNFYDGTTQHLNNDLTVPTPFHKGNGVRPYGSVLVEYRPGRIWGAMLNVGYDGLGAKYDNVVAPCDCPATLKTNISYVSIEPSLRFGFNTTNLYFFAGPSVAIDLNNSFYYTQLKQPNTDASLSEMHKTLISGQVGAGYDIPLSSSTSTTQFNLSPFVSYHPYFGQEPRTIESLSITTVRIGVALKFGKRTVHPIVKEAPVAAIIPAVNVAFLVTTPNPQRVIHQVSETFPLISVVFFDQGSTQIPVRYITLTESEASAFKIEKLQQESSENLAGHSAGQLNVYHNVLNVLGDRMRSNPGASIVLNGASAKGPIEGKLFAESVKQYLVTVFGIEGSRIAIEGSYKAHPQSQQPGGTKDLTLLHAEDNRVDIESTSPELFSEVGGGMMTPVQITSAQTDSPDNEVVLHVDSVQQLLKSWSVTVTDDKGAIQQYGPFTNDQQSLPLTTILANKQPGDYKIAMTAETKNGTYIKKDSTVHLGNHADIVKKGLRYSIVFDFDKANTIASYHKFLTDIVSPLVTDGATVIIHGHTDIIGEEGYNQTLSVGRAKDTQQIMSDALVSAGKTNVKFESVGYGADPNHSPFDNNLPEERFYNRTVTIDIVPAN